MAQGIVRWFNDSKGFGFIEQENGGEDVFVHHSAIHSEGYGTLQEGQHVRFQISKEDNGLRANNVEVLDQSSNVVPSDKVDRLTSLPTAVTLTPKKLEKLPAVRRADKVWFWGAAIAAGLILAAGSKQGAKPPQPVVSATPTAKAVVRSSAPVSVPVKLAGEKFSQTRLRLLSTDEVNNLTPDQLQYAISEMYARHGLAFRKRDRRKQFSQFSWYKPVKGKTESDSERQFSHTEKRNLQLLTQIRTGRQEKQARIAQELKNAKQQEEMAETPEPVQETPPVAVTESPYYGSSGQTTYVGPRGGIYHYSASGKKVYQKRR